MTSFEQYRGQWGGKITSGEEMWWSEPRHKLRQSTWSRFLFRLDVRHHFILRFWDRFNRDSKNPTPLKVIDFGCGTGGTTLNFSEMFRNPILGLDVFETQLQIARQFAQSVGSSSQFQRIGDEGRFPLADGSVDVVMSLDVLGHVPDVGFVLSEFSRVLKKHGAVILFTESTYSEQDHSIIAKLARRGADMMNSVPEHISLFPREELEEYFQKAGFEIQERFSANVGHFFFFPKDYVLMLKGRPGFKSWYLIANIWNRISKVFPFYPWPFELLRLLLTHLFGRKAFGTSYFYYLVKS